MARDTSLTQPLARVRFGPITKLEGENRVGNPDTGAKRDILFRVVSLPMGNVADGLAQLKKTVADEAGGREVVLFQLDQRSKTGQVQVALLWADELKGELPQGPTSLEADSAEGFMRLQGRVVGQHQVGVDNGPVTKTSELMPGLANADLFTNGLRMKAVSVPQYSVGAPPLDWGVKAMRFDEARALVWPKGIGGDGKTTHSAALIDIGRPNHTASRPQTERERNASYNFSGVGDPRDVADKSRKQGFDALDPRVIPGHGGAGEYDFNGPGFQGVPPGVLPEATLAMLKVNDRVTSWTGEAVARALRQAETDGHSVASVPHLVTSSSADLTRALKEAYENGMVVVAAPGSHIMGLEGSLNALTKDPTTIAAGASMPNGAPWQLTHGGKRLDVVAPGYGIPGVTMIDGKSAAAVTEGSTHSTNFVAAAALLWFEAHGAELESKYPEKWQRVEAFRWCLQQSSKPATVVDAAAKKQFGNIGQLDAAALVREPLPDPILLLKQTQ